MCCVLPYRSQVAPLFCCSIISCGVVPDCEHRIYRRRNYYVMPANVVLIKLQPLCKIVRLLKILAQISQWFSSKQLFMQHSAHAELPLRKWRDRLHYHQDRPPETARYPAWPQKSGCTLRKMIRIKDSIMKVRINFPSTQTVPLRII